MARRKSRVRRYYGRARRSYGRRSSKLTSTIKPYATGIGAGVMAEAIVAKVGMSQYKTVAGLAGAYFVGGTKGVMAMAAFDVITGQFNLNLPFLNLGTTSTSTSGDGW